jgi:ABC-type branched-subunit amino acid transport system substrate-binding protein
MNSIGMSLLLLAAACFGQQTGVYKDAREQPRGYFGPERDEPEPQGLDAVRIGYFGPNDPQHPQGGAMWLAVKLAIEEANQEGGYKGLPFRLVPGWAENPWAGGISSVTRMAYSDKVWAVIGSIDGASTHLAEQVVAKARLTLIDPASTDESVNEANVAWVFSCVPGDRPSVAAIGDSLLKAAPESFSLLTATDHDSRALAAEFKSFLSARRAVPRQHVEFAPGTTQAAEAVAPDVAAVVILAGAADSAHMARELRSRGAKLLIYGGAAMGRQSFLETAGSAAEGVRFPLLVEDPATKFHSADFAALHAYDATRILVAAIRKAGLNRARIRDAVEELAPWTGVSGVIRWDALGRNSRRVRLGTIRDGRVQQADVD